MRSLHSKNGANNYIFTWHDIKPFLNILTKINTYFFHWYTKAIILHIVNNKMKKLRFLSFLWTKVIWLKSFYFYDQTNKWKPKTLSEEWQFLYVHWSYIFTIHEWSSFTWAYDISIKNNYNSVLLYFTIKIYLTHISILLSTNILSLKLRI